MAFSNKTFKCVSHVIFDMDGVLLDTESLYSQAFKKILERYNKTFKREYQMEVMGTNTDVVSKYFVDKLGLPISYQEFTAEKEVEMALLLPSCSFLPGRLIYFSFTDTEIHYRKAISLIAQSFNKIYTPKIMGKVIGTPETETCRIAIKEMNLPLGIEQFRNMFVKLAHSSMNNVPLLAGTCIMPCNVDCRKTVKEVSHVIFDMDGTLLDTEKLYEEGYSNILKNFKKEMPREFRMKIMGMNQDKIDKLFINTFNLPISEQKFRELFDKEMDSMLPQNGFMPGAKQLVEHLHKHKIPIAVATSSGEPSYNLKTQNHKEFFNLFHHIVTGSTDPEVKNGKPAPDIFLICASRFPDKPKPEHCLVFEDSPNGVKGAVAANMQVVMVPDPMLDFSQTKDATMVLKSLQDFKPEIFGLPPFK